MQLCLDSTELNLIANILLERESEASAQAAAGEAASRVDLVAAPAKVDNAMCEEILQRVLARDTAFDSDELDQLAIILQQEQEMLNQKIAAAAAADKTALDRRRHELQHVLEKIEEVCVMI